VLVTHAAPSKIAAVNFMMSPQDPTSAGC